MLTWVMYDITEDKLRRDVIKICKDTGLYRVQKSVFLGDIEDNELDELKMKMKDTVDLIKDSVYVFPMTKVSFKKAGLIGQAFNKELVTDEVISHFL